MSTVFIIVITLSVIVAGYRLGLLPVLELVYQRKLEEVGAQLTSEMEKHGGNMKPETAGLIMATPLIVAVNLKSITIPDYLFSQARDGEGFDPFRDTPTKIGNLGKEISSIATEWMILNSPITFTGFFCLCYLPYVTFALCRMALLSLKARRPARRRTHASIIQNKLWGTKETHRYLDRRLFEPARDSIVAQLAMA